MSAPRLGAIVLAAGSASRMGFPKQLLRIEGQSLVRRAARAAVDAGCDPIAVVTGSNDQAVATELAGLPARIAFNPKWPDGMGTSIRRGLAELLDADPNLAAAVILVCDQPLLSGAIVRELLDRWHSSARPMAACEYAGSVGPPCCFGREIFGALSSIADGEGAKHLLLAGPESVARLPWPDGAQDLDTPEELRRFCREPPMRSVFDPRKARG